MRCLRLDKGSDSMKKTVKVSDLRVIDLRRELSHRSLDKTGLKPVLLERLRNALEEKGESTEAILVEENDQHGALGHLTNEDDEDELSSEEDKKTLTGIAIAKQLSRAAIERPESPLMSSQGENTPMSTPTGSPMCTPTGSHTFPQNELDDSTGHDGDLSADQVRESTHLPLPVTALQTLLSKIDGLHDSLDRERTEARDKEKRMYSKITELEKVLTALPKIDALTHTLEKEREEARDREQRLSNKIRELEKTIANLNTSVEESLKTCNTKLDKLSLRQHRPQTPEKRPANGGGQGAQTMQTDTGRSGKTHAPDSESSRSATSRGEQTTDLHTDEKKQGGRGAFEPRQRTPSWPDESDKKRQPWAEESDVATLGNEKVKKTSDSGDLSETIRQPESNWSTVAKKKGKTALPKPNVQSPDTNGKKPMGKLLGAERVKKKVYYLGGVHPDCVSNDIISFCLGNQCELMDCRLFTSKRCGTQAARITVEKSRSDILETLEWPDHMYVREWNFPKPTAAGLEQPSPHLTRTD